jgi:hypothetical protein
MDRELDKKASLYRRYLGNFTHWLIDPDGKTGPLTPRIATLPGRREADVSDAVFGMAYSTTNYEPGE